MNAVEQVSGANDFLPKSTNQRPPSLPAEIERSNLKPSDNSISAQGVKNLEIGVSMLQTAQNGLGKINATLGKMRNLAQSAATQPNLGAEDFSSIDGNMQNLADAVLNTAKTTQYGGIEVLASGFPGEVSIDAGDATVKQKLPNLLDASTGTDVVTSDGRVNLNNLKGAVRIKDAKTGQVADETLGSLMDSLDPIDRFYENSMRSLSGMSNLLTYQSTVLDNAIRAHEAIPDASMEDVVHNMAQNSLRGGNVYSSLV